MAPIKFRIHLVFIHSFHSVEKMYTSALFSSFLFTLVNGGFGACVIQWYEPEHHVSEVYHFSPLLKREGYIKLCISTLSRWVTETSETEVDKMSAILMERRADDFPTQLPGL